jgi:hypothetical protein
MANKALIDYCRKHNYGDPAKLSIRLKRKVGECMRTRMEEEDDDRDDEDDDDEEDKPRRKGRTSADDDDDEDDKNEAKRPTRAMRRVGSILGRGAALGLFMTDLDNIAAEALIADFQRKRVPFIAAWWGQETRVISAGQNSMVGVPLGKQWGAEEFTAQMLSGAGLDEFLVHLPGKQNVTVKGQELAAMARVMIRATKGGL